MHIFIIACISKRNNNLFVHIIYQYYNIQLLNKLLYSLNILNKINSIK